MAREHFFKSRNSDYFTEAELVKQIGGSLSKWGLILVKELIDNGLDAAEKIGVNPHITVIIDEDSLSVQDNGCGIPGHVIEKSLDYTGYMSDKAGYVSPSRGQQGNALKCVYSVPYVAMKDAAKVEIHSNGERFDISVSHNKISQNIDVEMVPSESSFVESGCFIKIHEFDLAKSTSQFIL